MNLLAHLAVKATVSGLIVAAASEAARRSPGWGGLIGSLPLVSLLAMIWLWRDSRDPARMADYALSTGVYVIGSLPAFAGMAWLLRRGVGFWPALAVASCVALAGYLLVGWGGRRMGLAV
jgi:hypothetical protein